MDQYFSVPQIGEVIRDLITLERMTATSNIETKINSRSSSTNEKKFVDVKHSASRESIGSNSMHKEESKLRNRNSALNITENKFDSQQVSSEKQILLGRVKQMIGKYSKLEGQLRTHGIDFILATGKTPQIDVSNLKEKSSRKQARSQMRNNLLRNENQAQFIKTGYFSSLDRGLAQRQLLYHQSSMLNNGKKAYMRKSLEEALSNRMQ